MPRTGMVAGSVEATQQRSHARAVAGAAIDWRHPWIAAGGARYLAKQLHPAEFADIDPVAELRRFHEQFLPVAFEGTWMTRLIPADA